MAESEQASSNDGFGYVVAIYVVICIVVLLLFSWWHRLKLTRRFYQPKCYVNPDLTKPKTLPPSYFGWIPRVVSISEDEIIRTSGVDAAMYIKILRMGFETFLFIAILCCAIMLPVCLTSDEVDNLMAQQENTAPSAFTWWIPPPPPPASPDSPPAPEEKDPEVPSMYNNTLGEAPPGLKWYQYLDNVPHIPKPEEFGYNSSFGWYYDDSAPAVKDYYFTNLDKYTIANIPPGDNKLYAPAILMWVITAFCLWQWWRYSQIALRLRQRYLLRVNAGAESRTVLCTDIPGIATGTVSDVLGNTPLMKVIPKSVTETATSQVKSVVRTASGRVPINTADTAITTASTASIICEGENIASLEAPTRWSQAEAREAQCGGETAMVEETFRQVFKDDFDHAHLCYNTSKLDKLVAAYNKVFGQAEDLVDDYIGKQQRGEELKPKQTRIIGAKGDAWTKEKYGSTTSKTDCFEYYADRLEYLKGEIEKEQVAAKNSSYPSAFVTFNRRAPQVVAGTALLSEDLTTWNCEAAPRPQEVIWKNIGMRSWERSSRTAMMWVGFFLLACFFMIPVAAVQALISSASVVDFIQDIPIVSTFLIGILPSLALIIFLAILPMILTKMNVAAGCKSEGEVDMGVVSQFYIFQVITVFFGSFLVGTFFTQLQQLINNPGAIVEVLGTGAPTAGLFFLSYLLTKALVTIPIGILSIAGLVIYKLKSKFAGTAKAKDRCWQNQGFKYGAKSADDAMTVLLGVTFAVVCPLVTIAAFLYFCTQYLVMKYRLVYTVRVPYQTGGMMWPRYFNQCITGLVIAQIVLIGLLGIKQIIAPPLIVLPLPFITLIFMHAAHKNFNRPFEVNSLMAASELDGYGPGAGYGGGDGADAKLLDEQVASTYVSPCFKFDEAAHQQVVDGCRKVKSAVDGKVDDGYFKSFESATDWDAMDAQFEEEEKALAAAAAADKAADKDSLPVTTADVKSAADGTGAAPTTGAGVTTTAPQVGAGATTTTQSGITAAEVKAAAETVVNTAEKMV